RHQCEDYSGQKKICFRAHERSSQMGGGELHRRGAERLDNRTRPGRNHPLRPLLCDRHPGFAEAFLLPKCRRCYGRLGRRFFVTASAVSSRPIISSSTRFTPSGDRITLSMLRSYSIRFRVSSCRKTLALYTVKLLCLHHSKRSSANTADSVLA